MIAPMRVVTWNVAGRVAAPARAGRGARGRRRRRRGAAGGHGAHAAAVARGPRRRGLPYAVTALDEPVAPAPRPLGVLDGGPRAARAAAAPPGGALARARALLPRGRDGGHQCPLADRAVARAGQGPHPRGGRRPPRDARARPADPLRRPQHTPPRAPRRRRADLRPRQRGRGCARSAASAGTRPSARSSTTCARTAGSTPTARCTATATLGELDVRERPRRLAPRPRARRTGSNPPAPTRTSGAAPASATTRRWSPTSPSSPSSSSAGRVGRVLRVRGADPLGDLAPRSRNSVRARFPTPEPQHTGPPLRSVRRNVAST